MHVTLNLIVMIIRIDVLSTINILTCWRKADKIVVTNERHKNEIAHVVRSAKQRKNNETVDK